MSGDTPDTPGEPGARRRLVDTLPATGMESGEARQAASELAQLFEGAHREGRVFGPLAPGDLYRVGADGPSPRLEVSRDEPGRAEAFAAPETARGEAPTVRGDIYALCAVLYLLASGRQPTPAAEREDAVGAGRPDPLVDISADRELQGRHGLAFLDAIMAGLELDPSERPASIADWFAIFEPRRARPTPAGAPTARRSPAGSRGAPGRLAPQPEPAGGAGGEMRVPTFEPEPERRPWGRMLAGGVLLAAIAAAGAWLLVESSGDTRVAVEDTAAGPSVESPEPPRPSADNEAWVRALEQDTLEGYRAYLEAFPDGRFAGDAQAEIDRYDDEAWAEAERRETLAGYESYLESWPEGRHASKARERAEAIRSAQEAAAADAAERAAREAADWEQAARQDTVESYSDYLGKHPTGPNAQEARSRRDRLQAAAADEAAFRQASAVNTVRAYEQYLSQFPNGAFQVQAVAALDALKPTAGRTFRDCASCPLMVTLPAGTAQLGAPASDADASPAEGPQRPVSFTSFFAISETEVTFQQWQACVAGGGCQPVASDNGWGRGTRPVINVTWNDAMAYAAWLSQETGQDYSLPSEAQWEYAARGGQTGALPGGSAAAVCAQANGAAQESGLAWANTACADPAPDRTLPAGSLIANGFGVKDMVGNVAEWTLDCNTLNLRDAPADGTADLRGSCNQRAVRGGSWFSGPKDLRFTARLMLRRGDSNDFTGFRVVRKVSGG